MENECIIVGEEVKSFSIRLGDSIMASLKLSRVRRRSFFPSHLSLLLFPSSSY